VAAHPLHRDSVPDGPLEEGDRLSGARGQRVGRAQGRAEEGEHQRHVGSLATGEALFQQRNRALRVTPE
jgi:hypothetical protein